MKVLFWRMKVALCNFATSKSIKTLIKMKKILSLILVMMAVTLPVIAQESSSSSSTYWQVPHKNGHGQLLFVLSLLYIYVT